MTHSVAFLCLGVMGTPMAGHLVTAGHRVVVYNRTRARADAWLAKYESQAAEGAAPRVVASAALAVEGADFVFVCTGNDDDLRAVVLAEGKGALHAMAPGTLLVDHTTASPTIAREIHAAGAAREIGCLDAPVSGGQAGAENGALTIMVGGDADHYARVAPLLDVYARKHLLMGESGSGQLTKAVNQICIAGLVQALSEGLRFAEAAGLDAARVVDVISQGAAQSWQMDNRAESMLARRFNYGFAVDWMRKDLAIALAEAERTGAPLPITQIIDGFYAEIQEGGGGRFDTSSLITRFDFERKP